MRTAGHQHALVGYALEQLQQVPDVEVYGPEADERGGVIAFNMTDMHPHDIASILDQQGVAIRAGPPLRHATDANVGY